MRSIRIRQESVNFGSMLRIACIVKPAISNPLEKGSPGWYPMAVMVLNFKICNTDKII
jgi:hypothetical protein